MFMIVDSWVLEDMILPPMTPKVGISLVHVWCYTCWKCCWFQTIQNVFTIQTVRLLMKMIICPVLTVSFWISMICCSLYFRRMSWRTNPEHMGILWPQGTCIFLLEFSPIIALVEDVHFQIGCKTALDTLKNKSLTFSLCVLCTLRGS